MTDVAASPTLIVTDRCMLDHDPGRWHPESPSRLARVLADLDERPVPGTRRAQGAWATYEQLARAHTEAHVELVTRQRGRHARFDQDTATSPGTVDAAYAAAGSAIHAVTAVVRGEAANALVLARPPGHHAESSRAMGFCFFNNIAVAATHALDQLGVERVLVLDWDYHHGNGTQQIFYDRRDVLVFNTHRYGCFPGTGAAHELGLGPGEGYSVNVPLPGGMTDADLALAFAELALPIADDYRPDVVLVSAGFDAHRDDPLGDMRASDEGFAALCGVAAQIARDYAGGRLVLSLEGGYDLAATSRSARACLEVMTGATPPEFHDPSRPGVQALRDSLQHARPYWRHVG